MCGIVPAGHSFLKDFTASFKPILNSQVGDGSFVSSLEDSYCWNLKDRALLRAQPTYIRQLHAVFQNHSEVLRPSKGPCLKVRLQLNDDWGSSIHFRLNQWFDDWHFSLVKRWARLRPQVHEFDLQEAWLQPLADDPSNAWFAVCLPGFQGLHDVPRTHKTTDDAVEGDPWLEPVEVNFNAGHLQGRQITPTHQLPLWVQTFLQLSDDLGIGQLGDDSSPLLIRSWYLNPHRFVKWSSWRQLKLDRPADAWMSDVRDVWCDILDDTPVSFHVVTPQVPRGRGEERYIADLILTQQTEIHQKANLLALVFLGQFQVVHTEAHLVSTPVSKWTTIFTFEADRFCGGPAWNVNFHRLCEVFHGTRQLSARLEDTFDGASYVIEAHPPMFAHDAELDDPDHAAFLSKPGKLHQGVSTSASLESTMDAEAGEEGNEALTKAMLQCYHVRHDELSLSTINDIVSARDCPDCSASQPAHHEVLERIRLRFNTKITGPTPMGIIVQVWLVDNNQKISASPRNVFLSSNVSQWMTDIHDAWSDRLTHEGDIDMELIAPDLPAPTAWPHDVAIILFPTPCDCCPILVTAMVQSLRFTLAYQVAVLMPYFVDSSDVLSVLPRHLHTTSAQTKVWHGMQLITADCSHEIAPGNAVLVTLGEFDITHFRTGQLLYVCPHDAPGDTNDDNDDSAFMQTALLAGSKVIQSRNEVGDLPWQQGPNPDPGLDDPTDDEGTASNAGHQSGRSDHAEFSPSGGREPSPSPVIAPPSHVPPTMQNVLLLRMLHEPIMAVVSWDRYEPMMREIAGHYGQYLRTLLATHEVSVRLPGTPEGVTVLIVQFVHDLPLGSDYVLCVVDLELHESQTQVALPTWKRLVVPLPARLCRVQLLRILRLQVYCSVEHDRCIVQHDLQLWALQDLADREVSHGMYFRVIVPPSRLSMQSTSCLISARNAGLPDDGMDPLMAQILGIPVPSVDQPPPDDEDDAQILMQSPGTTLRVEFSNEQSIHDLISASARAGHIIPGYFPVQIWFIHPVKQPVCEYARFAWLSTTPDGWTTQIEFLFRDLLTPDVPIEYALVHPQPWENSDDDAVHIMAWQEVPLSQAPIQVNVYDSLYNGGLPTRSATLAAPVETKDGLLQASAAFGRCWDPLRVECSVWWGTIEIVHGVTFPVRPAYAFNIVIQHQLIADDVWEGPTTNLTPSSTRCPVTEASLFRVDETAEVPELPASLPLQSCDISPANALEQDDGVDDDCDSMALMQLAQASSPKTRDSISVDEGFPKSVQVHEALVDEVLLHAHVDRSAIYYDAPILGQAPMFLWTLHRHWNRLQTDACWDETSSFPVVTWFLNFRSARRCEISRPVILGPDWKDWPRQLQSAWKETIDPTVALHFFVVTPQVQIGGRFSVHVLLVQHDIPHEKAILAVTSDLRSGLNSVRLTALVQSFALVPESLLLSLGVFSDCRIIDIPSKCSVFANQQYLPWSAAYYPNNGDALHVTLEPSSSQSSADAQDDVVLFLQSALHRIRMAQKPPMPVFEPFHLEKSDLNRRCPVQISLDQALPSSTPPLDDRKPMFQVLDMPSWSARLSEPWPSPLAWIPEGLDIPPSTWEALHEQWRVPPFPPKWLELYIDGSYSTSGAGWAVVVVAAHEEGKWFCGCMSGPVQTSYSQANWIGAAAESNITAEFSAAVVALAYGLTVQDLPVFLRPDLALTKTIIDHDGALQKNQPLGQLMAALSSQFPLGGQVWEVRAHQDDPWNELADRIAKAAALSGRHCGQVEWTWIHALASSPIDRNWLWLQTAPNTLQHSFPELHGGQVWQPSEVPISQCPKIDQSDSMDAQVTLHFSVATFNVLALGADADGSTRSLRAIRLSQQFHAKGLALVGLQEARTEQGVFVTDDYSVYSSGKSQCGKAVHHGCELWVHRRMAIATIDGRTISVASLRPVVVHADPRRLLVSFSGPMKFLVFVAHVPCLSSTTSSDDLQAWWHSTCDIIQKAASYGPIVALLDANAPLASDECSHYGLSGAEPMNDQGYQFQDALHQLNWAIPATLGFHVGPSHTWQHPSGSKLRRDYVGVSLEWLSLVSSTSTMTDVDGGFQHEDHLPSLCSFHGFIPASLPAATVALDSSKLKDPACVQAFQSAIASLPVPTWNVPVDDHAHTVEHQILQISRQCFGSTSKRPRTRPVLREATLSLIGLKRQVLDWMRRSPPDMAADLLQEIKHIEKQLRPLVREDQRRWYEEWLNELQSSAHASDSKKLFRMLQRLGRKRDGRPKGPRPLPMLKRPDGEPAQNIAECQTLWRDHFACIEAGLQVSVDDLAAIHQQGTRLAEDDLDLNMIPTLWEVQSAMGRVKPGKAAGPNALPPDIFKIGGLPLAVQFNALMVKASVEGREPLKWKGGNLIPLWKGKGSMAWPENFRAIFVSNISAKLYHSCVRARLEAIWLSNIDSLQQGGRKGFGTDLSHHILQAFLSWGRHRGASTAILFVDLHSAFYSVWRGSLFPGEVDTTFLRQAFDRFAITPHDLADILGVTASDHALEGLSAHGHHVLMDFFSAAFFQMHSTEGVTLTTRGTRPGDPLGDLLFNMVFRLVMKQARTSFLQISGLPWLGNPDRPTDFSMLPDLPDSFHFQMAFVDDLACALALPGTDYLMSNLASMTSCLHDAARQRGLELNYRQGKTEAMVCPAGTGSRALRQSLWRQSGGIWPVLVEHGILSLRLVLNYKHLGTHLQDRAITGKDRGLRIANARQAFGPLSKSFFTKRVISLGTKCRVFDSLVVARHVYNVHTWSWLTDKEIQSWSNGLRPQVFQLVRPRLKGLSPNIFSTVDLYGILGSPAPEDVLHANRLRYFARCVAGAPTILWQLILANRSAQSWFHALQTSFQWLRDFHTRREWPAATDVLGWILQVQLSKRWKGCVTAALKSSLQFRQQVALAKIWEKDIERTLSRQAACNVPQPDPVAGLWQCGMCDASFQTTRGLAMHCSKVHGYRPWAKYYMQGSTCLACGMDFAVRPRALIHLSARFACAASYRACFPPMSDEQVKELDDFDCQHAREMAQQGWGRTKALLPASRIPVPLLPQPHTDEARRMHAFWQDRMQGEAQGIHQLHGWRRQDLPDDTDAQSDTPVGDGIIPFVGNSPAGVFAGSVGQFQDGGLSLSTVRVFLTARVFVHLYSGHRRHGDLQWTIENQWWTEDVVCFCLSVDLCLEKQKSDMARQDNVKFWKDRLLSGQLLGIGGGPSCETWTAARLQEGGPRPLRCHATPWGNKGLSKKEWDQVILGTTLLRVLVDLLLLAARAGLCGFLEHPAFPSWAMKLSPSSIWALPVLRMLAKLQCFSITSFDQCTLGLPARKPTTMLLLRMKETRRLLLSRGHQGRCNHGHAHVQLRGRDEQGAFRTAVAKIYPPALNEALAVGVLRFASDSVGAESSFSERMPDELLPLLSVDFVDYSVVQPDYHGR